MTTFNQPNPTYNGHVYSDNKSGDPYIHEFVLPQGTFDNSQTFSNISGGQVTFVVTQFPLSTGNQVFLNGNLITISSGAYTIVGNSIVLPVAPVDGSELKVYPN